MGLARVSLKRAITCENHVANTSLFTATFSGDALDSRPLCIFNASSLLLSRFHAAKFEVGLRRAVGASKSQILTQGLIESSLLGVVASVFAIGLSGLFLIFSTEMLPNLANLAVLNGETLIAGVILSIVTANLASLYSIYRANRYTISAELK